MKSLAEPFQARMSNFLAKSHPNRSKKLSTLSYALETQVGALSFWRLKPFLPANTHCQGSASCCEARAIPKARAGLLCSDWPSCAGEDVRRQDRAWFSWWQFLIALHWKLWETCSAQWCLQGSLCQKWLKHPSFQHFQENQMQMHSLCCCSAFHCLHSSRSQIVHTHAVNYLHGKNCSWAQPWILTHGLDSLFPNMDQSIHLHLVYPEIQICVTLLSKTPNLLMWDILHFPRPKATL